MARKASGEEDSEPILPQPEHWMSDEEVESSSFEYSDREPGDWVSSGLLGDRFDTWSAAEKWARQFFGDRYKGRVREAELIGDRWAFLIRGVQVKR